jgi:hypothetical protein
MFGGTGLHLFRGLTVVLHPTRFLRMVKIGDFHLCIRKESGNRGMIM